jgi:hypothetical protein
VAKEVDAVQTVQRPLPEEPVASWAITPEDLTGERLPARLQVCQQYFGECEQQSTDVHKCGWPPRRPWTATFALCGASRSKSLEFCRKGHGGQRCSRAIDIYDVMCVLTAARCSCGSVDDA